MPPPAGEAAQRGVTCTVFLTRARNSWQLVQVSRTLIFEGRDWCCGQVLPASNSGHHK
jgi:hypothetical protein